MSKQIFDRKKILKLVEPQIKEKVKEIVNDIQQYSENAIEGFYNDYSPAVYQRTFSLFNVGHDPYIHKMQNGYKITFIYSGESLTGRKQEKFDDVFMSGYHGNPEGWGKGIPPFKPSPWERIFTYARNKYNAI